MTTDQMPVGPTESAAPRRRPRRRRWPWIAVATSVAVVAVILVWFQPQKLIIDDHVNDPEPAGSFIEVARGEFVSREHRTSGVARVLVFDDGRRIVRIDDLETSNGPALHVYLSSNPAGGIESAFDDGSVDLGGLRGNIGSQSYDIPSTADITLTTTVVIWCDRFDAAFGAADLVAS